MREQAEAIIEKNDLKLNIDSPVGSLSSVEKAMLAIIRAVESLNDRNMGGNKGLLVLDEPTVFLPKTQVDILFNVVRRIADSGASVLFVSHDIDEVMDLTNKFTVLRDGEVVANATTKDVSKSDIIEMIVGKKLEVFHKSGNSSERIKNEYVFGAEHISGLVADDVSFNLKKGEILGLTGLVGSGFDEIPYILFGAQNEKYGQVVLNGKSIDLKNFTPKDAVSEGMALLPSDRANAGGISEIEVGENLVMQTLDVYNSAIMNKQQMKKDCEQLVSHYNIHPNDYTMNLANLSGGNQQKVILAKWMHSDPKVLILHEPTQGIDIGARQQIYQYIVEAAQNGAGIMCLSSDYEQLETICDRVLVFHKGVVVGELCGDEISKKRIITLCYGN